MTITLPSLLTMAGILFMAFAFAALAFVINGFLILAGFDSALGEWAIMLRWPMIIAAWAFGLWFGISLL